MKIFDIDLENCKGNRMVVNFLRQYALCVYNVTDNPKYTKKMYSNYSDFIQCHMSLIVLKKAISQWFDYKISEDQLSNVFELYPEMLILSKFTVEPESYFKGATIF